MKLKRFVTGGGRFVLAALAMPTLLAGCDNIIPYIPNVVETPEVEYAAPPEADLEEGKYNAAQTVTLTSPDGGSIYYTTNEHVSGISTAGSTRLYNAPITLTENAQTIIKAIAIVEGKSPSAIMTKTYIVDMLPPGNVIGLTAEVGDKYVALNWTDPPDADLSKIEISWTGVGSGSKVVDKSAAAGRKNYDVIPGLINGGSYNFTFKTIDDVGNKQITGHSTGNKSPVLYTGTKKEWKVLWAICKEFHIGSVQNIMTDEQIEHIMQKAQKFEEFIETNTHNRLNIVTSIEIMQSPVTQWNGEGTIDMPAADKVRLNPEVNYNSCILTVDFSNVPDTAWRGINWGFYSLVPFKKVSTGNWMTYQPTNEQEETSQINTFVHEWLHQIESAFPGKSGYWTGGRIGLGTYIYHRHGDLDATYPLPILDNDINAAPEFPGTAYSNYTMGNLQIYNDYQRVARWLADYVGGTIVHYPGATNILRGVHEDWWQYL